MRLGDFDYDLPSGFIAQHPPDERENSRLLVMNRRDGLLAHSVFSHLPDYLRRGDVLVVNDTKVVPARLIGKKESGGRVEILLVRKKESGSREIYRGQWECLVQGSGRLREKTPILLSDGIRAELLERSPDGLWQVSFQGGENENVEESLRRIGFAPLPPYIHRNGDREWKDRDLERYQTVYARWEGAIAAPTAGLHFTERLLEEIRRKGVSILSLTLHVGRGTFLPVKSEEIEEHRPEPEDFEIRDEVAEAVNRSREAGGRVIGVGTTVTRALESAADSNGKLGARKDRTGLFIYPGYRFRVLDGLVTNFHLPRSTLLMLVAAFAGRESILAAYEEAVRRRYRFYSYGDAMLIL